MWQKPVLTHASIICEGMGVGEFGEFIFTVCSNLGDDILV